MKTKVLSIKSLGLLVLILGLGAFLTNCSKMKDEMPTSDQETPYKFINIDEAGTNCTPIIAGQFEEVGNVCLVDDIDNEILTVTYTVTGDWEMTEIHFAVANSTTGIPHTKKKNNLIPGQFPYIYTDPAGFTTYTFTLPMSDFGFGSCDDGLTYFGAAHCAVQKVEGGVVTQTETGWGFGSMTPGNSWGTIFPFTVECDNPPPGGGGESSSETAFAFGCENATCFLEIDEDGDGIGDFNRWGWTNGPLTDFGTYYYPIYAAAGQCDWENKGTLVGQLIVEYDGTQAIVTYNTCGGYTLNETHLYVGCDLLATDVNGDHSVAPGQYGNIHEALPAGTTSDTYTIILDGEPCTSGIHIVAHAVVSGNYEFGSCSDGDPDCYYETPCTPEASWADFSGMPTTLEIDGGSTTTENVTLCDNKTVAVQATNISSSQFKFNGGPLGESFWVDNHSLYGDLNNTGTSRMNTRCLDGSGSPNGVMPNGYTLTWDFGSTPLDYTNFFMVGQFWRPENILTITAYAEDGVTPIPNTAFAFEWLKASTGSYTFLEPLTWNPASGTLKKTTIGDGPNSGYGFFSIPEGTLIGKIVFSVYDSKTSGTADELNWGIGCFACPQ